MSLQRCLDLKDLEKLKTFRYTVRKLDLKAKQLHFWATDCPDCQFKKGLLLSLSVKEMFEIGKKVVVSFDLSLICATAQYTAKR